MRIPTLLQKISDLAAQPERRTAIDVDLMLDYTRVLYADLLEWRSRLPATAGVASASEPAREPTLVEISEALEKRGRTEAGPIQTQIKKEPEPVPEIQKPGFSQQDNPKDIRGLIGINDKYQIMSELFGNDKTAYERALDFINQSKSENAALHWLQEQLWITEEHSDAAQSFFEIVGRFFRS